MYLFHLLQEGPVNTNNYMIAGYTVIFGVMLIYLISIYLRQRNLEQDLELLEELQERES
jgi:hypothetical protein